MLTAALIIPNTFIPLLNCRVFLTTKTAGALVALVIKSSRVLFTSASMTSSFFVTV